MVTPVANAIEEGLSQDYQNWRPTKIIVKMGLLISAIVIAFVFSHFENLMAIIGSIFVVLVSLVVPCLCHLKISNLYRSWSFGLVANGVTVDFRILAGILGTCWSVKDILKN